MSPKTQNLKDQYQRTTPEPLPDYSEAEEPKGIPLTTMLLIVSPFLCILLAMFIYALFS